MPHVVRLARKSDHKQNTEANSDLWTQIDQEICQFLNVPVDEKHWCNGWYGYIAFLLAAGRTFEQIDAGIKEWLAKADSKDAPYIVNMLKINAYLQANFTADAWREWK